MMLPLIYLTHHVQASPHSPNTIISNQLTSFPKFSEIILNISTLGLVQLIFYYQLVVGQQSNFYFTIDANSPTNAKKQPPANFMTNFTLMVSPILRS